MSILDSIADPGDVHKLTSEEKTELCGELREKIIDTVADNGGHLASNLGVIELTVAVYSCFTPGKDRLIFDVGHQCYAHKLLSGRLAAFHTLRKSGGISGFTKRDESPLDPFGAGHSGTALSASLGFAEADRLDGSDAFTVAVIGDGSFTNGMVYEALNNIRKRGLKLIIILNDNEMSISPNVGALSGYLRRLRSSKRYFRFKNAFKRFFAAVPLIGGFLTKAARDVKNFLKRILLKSTMFEDLGLDYLGPLDGNDLQSLEAVLTEAKTKDRPAIIHICTKKGAGYPPAVKNPERYHAVSPFDRETGLQPSGKESYASVFGEELTRLAANDADIIAITAAMSTSTGLDSFKKTFPERFFDVGIAEEHAATFAAGLAAAGKKPVFAVYSTFAQRIYDQAEHDAALQRLPVMFMLDHAGLVPGDGQTHQGIFDIALFSPIQGMTIYAPDSYDELRSLMRICFSEPRLCIIRCPKGKEAAYNRSGFMKSDFYTEKLYGSLKGERPLMIVTFGRLTAVAAQASEQLAATHNVKLLKLIRICPVPEGFIAEKATACGAVLFLEEAIENGGVSQRLAAELAVAGYVGKVRIHAVKNEVPSVGTTDELMNTYRFTTNAIVEEAESLF